ncbi:MAG: MlaD family protein [Myxococcota bacterium]|jgi:phospholipid/cholesterol/gamma-HCH transport system substrate-binding protein
MVSTPVNPAEREKRIIVRAGLFVALGLALAGIVVFLIGKERNLFEKENVYVGAFENVDGLQLDSPVRLGGLQVGRVSSIAFADDLEDKRIIVKMEISQRFAERIREDSVARITGRGVLGDKAIDISLGTPGKEQIANGGEIPTGTSGDISSLLKATGEMVDNAVTITRDLRAGVQAYTGPEVRDDVVAIVKGAKNIIAEIESGKGLLHTLVYDKRTSDDVKALLSRASDTAVKLDSAVARVDGLLADVKAGQGSLHALIYDKQIAQSIVDLGVAADEVARLIHDAKTSKDGAVYQLVYGDARTALGDLGKAAADVRAITQKIRAGEGSLGGIINDPTVYEDLKEVLGNVKRNRVLRELVRLSISNEDKLEGAGRKK